jgi:short-subunit dehydrogenase
MTGSEHFRERYGPWAIVAGASEGTGRSFARQIAAHGVGCILIANAGPLEAVAQEIKAESGVDCVAACIDLSAPGAFEQIVAVTGGREVGLYIANAGADPHGLRFLDCDVAAWLDLIRINITSTVRSCHHFGKLMLQRRRGGILIVNSGACYGGAGRLAIYTAVKAFQLDLCESLWSELRPFGIDVLSLVLGQTDTPAYHRLQAKKGKPSSPNLALPDDVARTGLARLAHGPVHNIGLADDAAGGLLASANTRRERVLRMDAAIDHLFGKIDAA